jgi:NTP pyrophosphatase (non-canonical NTP hydrolase)
MTLNEYQELAARTINPELTVSQQVRHALFGIASETGELLGLWQKAMQGHDINDEHMLKECGDILWMLAELLTAKGYTLDDVARMNIDKLKARYPDGFDTEHSLHRKVNDI